MPNFEDAIESYMEELRVARRCSPHTVSNYARDLRAVARSAKIRDLQEWKQVEAVDVRSIIAEQHREKKRYRLH